MSVLTSIIVVFVILIFHGIMSGLLSAAAANLTVGSDPHQQKAQNVLIIASVLGWISFVIVIILGVIFVFYGSEETVVSGKGKTVVNIFLGFIIFFFVLNGFLAMVAAIYISEGADFDSNKTSYSDCAWVAGLSLGAAGLVLIIYITKKVSAKHEALVKAQASP